jgi:hypothetical protein
MDAMKSSGAFPPDETAEEAPAAANTALVVEEFEDPDKNVAENEDTPAPLVAPMAEETEAKTSPVDSQPSSVMTYELPPPEMVDLPVRDCSCTLPVDHSYGWKDSGLRESSLTPPSNPCHRLASDDDIGSRELDSYEYGHGREE